MTDIQTPFVNMNGTDSFALQEQQLDVYRTAHALLRALYKATPHGRDYQTAPAPHLALSKAQSEWMARVRAVEAIIKDADAIDQSIRNQRKLED